MLTRSPSRLARDTAGQERYSSLAPLYYRGASAAAVVYDVTSPESFSKAKYWVSELQKNASGDIGAPRPPWQRPQSVGHAHAHCSHVATVAMHAPGVNPAVQFVGREQRTVRRRLVGPAARARWRLWLTCVICPAQ